MSINPADPRWLEILKASGWQTTALAIACVLIVVLVKYEVIPTTESPYWIAVPAICGVILWCLALAAMGSASVKAIKPVARFNRWRLRRYQVKAAREYILYMTDRRPMPSPHCRTLLHDRYGGNYRRNLEQCCTATIRRLTTHSSHSSTRLDDLGRMTPEGLFRLAEKDTDFNPDLHLGACAST